MMNACRISSHSNRLLLWTALPSALVLASIALSILGSSKPNHTPPPLEFSKFGGPVHSARDQP